MTTRSYVIVIEGDGSANYSAYVPDLPGCVATGDTMDHCEANMRDAIAFHIEGLLAQGLEIPEPTATSARVVRVA
jgi:predicted RNase H-like HicB family nuclease